MKSATENEGDTEKWRMRKEKQKERKIGIPFPCIGSFPKWLQQLVFGPKSGSGNCTWVAGDLDPDLYPTHSQAAET